MAEQKVPEGLVLQPARHQEGRTHPRARARCQGKPTVTMPHLEVGDYIETENITAHAGDGQLGNRYLGPHWFFREADIAYWRSEFVVISPKDRPLASRRAARCRRREMQEDGPLGIRRWRVDESPGRAGRAGQRAGAGVLAQRAHRLGHHARRSAAPPRRRRERRAAARSAHRAHRHADRRRRRGADRTAARKLYRWVLANVEDGRESDGRRVVIGKSGNRTSGFLYLAARSGIPVEMAGLQGQAEPPSRSVPSPRPSSSTTSSSGSGTRTPSGSPSRDKFAPFGYVPAGLRGQPAYRLVAGHSASRRPASRGTSDGVVYEGSGELSRRGRGDHSSSRRSSSGKAGDGPPRGPRAASRRRSSTRSSRASSWRRPSRARDSVKVDHREPGRSRSADRDAHEHRGHRFRAAARATSWCCVRRFRFASRRSRASPSGRRRCSSANRRTPRSSSSFKLPPGAKISSPLAPADVKDADRKVTVRDREEKGNLVLEREIDIPAGRVEPPAYKALQAFAGRADEATMREIVITLAR